ncbi:MAG: hypothetical protein COA78_21450 [Blastopirellula sp.]|nr:MAG: hypothetical protein COA78_21450 [Blastopirellula sp.]
MQPITQQEYRISPDLRRCCWYIIICGIPLIGVFYWVARFVQNRETIEILLGCLFFLFMGSITAILPLTWKLRVDEQGMTRSLLGLSGRIWSWNDFASGRILKQHRTLYDPARGWGRRTLILDFIGLESIQEVMAVINTHYQLPPPPAVPEKLTLRYGFFKTATFDSQGIHILIRGKPFEYQWPDVQHILITRMDPVRRNFSRLVIVLPDREIDSLRVGSSWSDVTNEEINEYLHAHAPEDCIQILIAGQCIKHRVHIEQNLKDLKQRQKDVRIIIAVFGPALALTLGWMALENVFKALAMFAMSMVCIAPPYIFIIWKQSKDITELENDLDTAIKAEQSLE